jgi:hypothetical protein
MNDDLRAMACHRYGYGCWNAPYWFLGLEEGMDRDESDNRSERIAAWRYFGSLDLDDCQKFHDRVFALIKKKNGLHGDDAVPQRTWKKLLLALMAFPGGPVDESSLLRYQRNKWGCDSGETCLIELSGLAARSVNIPHDLFQKERIEFISGKIADHHPTFVIMYGKRSHGAYRKITEQAKAIKIEDSPFAEFLKSSRPTGAARHAKCSFPRETKPTAFEQEITKGPAHNNAKRGVSKVLFLPKGDGGYRIYP